MRFELRSSMEKSPTGKPEDDFQPYVDTFLLDASRNVLGGVLILPGGGYHHRAFHEGDPVAEKFNELGYHAFVLQYRVAPYRYPAPQRDVIRAIKLIRSHAQEWYLDDLAVLGFSAGGHLAASCGVLGDRIDGNEGDEADKFSGKADAMILCYPVISLTAPISHSGSGLNLFGEDSTEAERAKLNVETLVDENTPPAFLWHTATDQAVNVLNSVEFAKAMWAQGKSCELHVFPEGPHGRGLGMGFKDLKKWPELAADFLELHAGFKRA